MRDLCYIMIILKQNVYILLADILFMVKRLDVLKTVVIIRKII